MKRETLDRLNADRAALRAVALVTDMKSGAQALVYDDGSTWGETIGPDLVAEAQKALSADKSGPVESAQGDVFIQAHNPPLRLFIVGAVHITQALAHMAQIAGYAVTVIDPRRAFAAAARFPGLEVSTEWPDEIFKRANLDRRTAIATLTHDPKIDDPALEVALRSDVFYIGSLGSTRTHGKRLTRLHEAGFSEADTARIHAPIGLDIGAKSPAEIALSIMAEITEVRRKGPRSAAGKAA